jgi:hypothetical protein
MKAKVKSPLAALSFILLASLLAYPQVATQEAKSLFTMDATKSPASPEAGYLEMGSGTAGKSPTGHSVSVNSRYLTMDGKPWLPVMGEFHYSRYPERYWEEEILKMKAGGIQIVSTYVFWIHHEEVEGQFDWSGDRNLRKFVELCGKHGMYVYPRIGPWDHGEVRNGGFPDWLLKKGPTRVNDPVYLSYVRRLYDQVGQQLKGLLWKDGGPIVGIQLENEYANRAANGGATYISQLKKMSIEAGLDVPLYTVTGWDNAVYPPREVIPVFGGYPDEPWSGSLQQLPPDTQGVYQFHLTPITANAGILQGKSEKTQETQLWHYPRFTVELGAGMQLTYHRRVVVNENDIPPMAFTALGSGVNMLGYYMFQGGENPQGKLTTLQESQATDYPNDVPVKSYDFQAPLRAYGQMNGAFRKLKVIHQFIADFGSDLAPMTAILPDTVPSGPHDTTTLRLAARTDGKRGYLFFSNYLRNYPLPEQKGVQVMLKLPGETITLPREPFDVPSQTAFVWPVNLDLGGALLRYATAQPFAKIHDGKTDYYFFSTSGGIEPEFAFAASSLSSLKAAEGKISRDGDRETVSSLKPSTGVAIEIRTQKETTIRIVLLSPEQAENSWKISIHGQDHLLATSADVFSDGESIHLRSRNTSALSFSIIPRGDHLSANAPLQKTGDDGVFTHYTASVSSRQVQVTMEKVRDAAPSDPVKMGRVFDWRQNAVAEAPDDSHFAKASVWRLSLPKDAWKNFEDVFLDISYVGDAGRLYKGDSLLDDDFYNGTPWEIGIKRFPPDDAEGLELRILPLRKDAPIYMPKNSWPNFGGKSDVVEVKSVTASPEYELILITR